MKYVRSGVEILTNPSLSLTFILSSFLELPLSLVSLTNAIFYLVNRYSYFITLISVQMKKMYLLLLLAAMVSFASYAQENDDLTSTESDATPTNLTQTTSPQTNTWTTRCRYCYTYHSPSCQKCSICYRYHTPNCTPQNTPVPIDGGLSVLLVAGAAYGVKRIRRKKQ